MKLHDSLSKIIEQTTKKVQRGVTGCTTSSVSISIGTIDPSKSTVRVSVKLSDGSVPLYSYTLNETELKITINQEFTGFAYIDWEISE